MGILYFSVENMFLAIVLLAMGWLVALSECEIMYKGNRYYINSGKRSVINSLDVDDNMVGIASQANFAVFIQKKLDSKVVNITKPSLRMIYLPSVNYANYQIRTYRKNVFNISSNYLIFSNVSLMYTDKDLNPINSIYNSSQLTPNNVIKQAIFTETNETIVVVSKLSTFLENTYKLTYLTYNGSSASPHFREITVNAYSTYCSIRYHQNQIFILFTDLIQVYADNSSMTLLKELTIASGNTESPSMSLQNDMLVYCITAVCRILNLTDDYSLIQQIQLEKLVTDVGISIPFLLIVHETSFIQYDIQAKVFISEIVTKLQFNKIMFLTEEYFLAYQKYPAVYNITYIYGID